MRAAWLSLVFLSACAQKIVVGDAGRADSGAIDGGAIDGAAIDGATLDGGRDDDAGDASDSGSDPGQCRRDRFAKCTDSAEVNDPDNEWVDARYVSQLSVGCRSGDDLVPLDTKLAGKICPTDPADWYQQTMVCCDTLTLHVTIRLHLTEACDASAYRLVLSGHPCDGGDPNLRCETEANGDQVIDALIPPCNVVFGWYFGVEKLRDDVELGYELSVTVQ